MTTCPHCEGSVPDRANFCKHCGKSLDQRCPSCEETVPAEANFCPNCRAELTGADPARPSDEEPLRLSSREFAKRLDDDVLGGEGLLSWFNRRKELVIESGNSGLLIEDGKLVERLDPGRHTVDSLTQRIANLQRRKDLSVVLVEDRETSVDIAFDNLRTASGDLVTVYVDLAFRIDDPEKFANALLADRTSVTANTFEGIFGETIRDELEATISEYEREELYGNRGLKTQFKSNIASACQATFERCGLTLVEVRSFDYDDDREEIREERQQVEIRKEREDIEDERSRLDRRERERSTDDVVHEQQQRVRRETTKQQADQEIETQEIEHEHEQEDIQRRHHHRAEREDVEHEQEKKTTRKEGNVERRELEHEQDVEEMEDLMDLKKRKDMDNLDVEKREQDIEMQREEHEVEIEKDRLQARDEVDLETLASMDGVDESVAELAEMEKAGELTPEQLEALGAQDSDELAKARQEAHSAEKERERVEDQKEFREEIKEMSEDSMDRMQETTESAMDNMGETGKAAAEDTSDNVIVSDTGSDDGDTTIVQGGGSGSDSGGDRVVVCPECDSEVSPDDDFCLNCGAEFKS